MLQTYFYVKYVAKDKLSHICDKTCSALVFIAKLYKLEYYYGSMDIISFTLCPLFFRLLLT